MKVNKRLVNILLIMLIMLLGVYLIPPIYDIVKTIIFALSPLIIAFLLAFILNPLISYLEKFKIPRMLAIIIVITSLIAGSVLLIFGVMKPAVDRLGDISVGIDNIFTQIGQMLNLDTTEIKAYVINVVNDLVNNIDNFFSATGGTVEQVWSFFVSFAVVFIVGVIFLYNFPAIKEKIKNYLKENRSEKTYYFVKSIDTELTNYLIAELIIAVIQFIEYTALMLLLSIFYPALLNHVLLVGIVAAVLSLIPYFGGYISIIFTGIIIMSVPNAGGAMIGLILFMLIFPQLDAYVINPRIFKKHLKLNPFLTIAFILISSALFGIIGVIISVPVYVILMIIYQSYYLNIKEGLIRFKDSI